MFVEFYLVEGSELDELRIQETDSVIFIWLQNQLYMAVRFWHSV